MKRKDKEGNTVKLFDFEKYLKTVNWNVAMALGIFSVLGTAIGSDVCGIKQWLLDSVGPVLADSGSIAMGIVCVVGVSLITNVFNNNAVATIFASLAAPLSTTFIVNGQLNPGRAARGNISRFTERLPDHGSQRHRPTAAHQGGH